MRKRSWQKYAFALAVVVALAIVANAELRVLLLLADALGLELVVLLVVIQIRLLAAPIAGASATLAKSFFVAVNKHVLRAIPSCVMYRPMALCPVFWLFSYANYLVWCRHISSMDIHTD